jgi:hypothetical protein
MISSSLTPEVLAAEIAFTTLAENTVIVGLPSNMLT